MKLWCCWRPVDKVKSALIIVAAVAGCSLLEIALLFSMIAPPRGQNPATYQLIACGGAIALLPGTAALISWAINGSYRWVLRSIRIFLGALLTIPTAFFIVACLIALAVWSYGVSRLLFGVLLPIELCAVLLGLLFLVGKSGAWGAKVEAERWLAERQSQTESRERPWRNRAAKFAVCIPGLIVLPIFLFLPETLGFMWHLLRSQSDNLHGYRISIPTTWMAVYRVDSADGSAYFGGLAGRGIGRGANPISGDSLSSWTFGTESYSQSDKAEHRYLPRDYIAAGGRILKIGNERVTCTEYRYSHAYDAIDLVPDSRLVHVSCSGPGRLYASMYGGRDQLPAFYQVLSAVSPTK